MNFLPLAFISPSGPEILIVLAIVVLLFGKRIPGVMNSLGRSMVEFKKGKNEAENDDSETGSPTDSHSTPA